MAGILAAIAAGRLDELDPRLPEEHRTPAGMTPTNIAKLHRRDAHRAHLREKRRERRSPF